MYRIRNLQSSARAVTLAAAVLLVAAAVTSGQSIVDRFNYVPTTNIPNWSTEFGGDWVADGAQAVSDKKVGWQYMLRDSVQDLDCVVETVVGYEGKAHTQFAGPIARATIVNNVLKTYMVKTQDNVQGGSGKFNTGYIYYYESPLVMQRLSRIGLTSSTLVRTRILVMNENSTVRVMAFFDTDQDGVWNRRVTVFSGALRQVSGGVGLNGFSSCFADDWKYFNACLYAKKTGPRPGETLELVARCRPNTVYLAASSLSNTGFPLGGVIVPLYPDPLFALSRNAPAIFQNFTGVSDANGDAVLKVAIPDDEALRGIIFYTAFVSVSATNPGRVDEVSNDAQVKIGG